MLNDSQKIVFRGVADNKATFECLKEFFQEKFQERIDPTGMTNEDIGAIGRAQWLGLKTVEDAFKEIASCKTIENKLEGINPAR